MITFESWIKYVFDREVTELAWYWQQDDFIELNPDVYIDFGTRLFSDSGELLKHYSDAQVNHGLNFLISINVSDQIFALKNPSVPLPNRLVFLHAIFNLNRDCFLPRCTPHLSHLDRSETPKHISPLNGICYMWWDIFIIYGDREDKAVDPLNRASIDVMEKSLTLPNIAIQEGALHGLGHFSHYYPEECSEVIDAFLKTNQDLQSELCVYAQAARNGAVL